MQLWNHKIPFTWYMYVNSVIRIGRMKKSWKQSLFTANKLKKKRKFWRTRYYLCFLKQPFWTTFSKWAMALNISFHHKRTFPSHRNINKKKNWKLMVPKVVLLVKTVLGLKSKYTPRKSKLVDDTKKYTRCHTMTTSHNPITHPSFILVFTYKISQ